MNDQSDPDVLVVGAGPVGLVAALFLEQYGDPAQIVDTQKRTTQYRCALAIHPGTFEPLLGQVGLTTAQTAAGADRDA